MAKKKAEPENKTASRATPKAELKKNASRANVIDDGDVTLVSMIDSKNPDSSAQAVNRQLKRQRTDAQVDRVMRLKVQAAGYLRY